MKPVLLHPKILEWEHFATEGCLKVLVYLLMEAKQRRTTYKGIEILRGQVIHSGRGAISRKTGLKEGVVRGSVRRMIDSGDISHESKETAYGESVTIITITNYEQYQDWEPKKRAVNKLYQTVDAKTEKEFVESYNAITGRRIRGLDPKASRQLNARLKEKYTIKQICGAIKNAMQDDHHKEHNFRYLTPEYITRGDKLTMWLPDDSELNTGDSGGSKPDVMIDRSPANMMREFNFKDMTYFEETYMPYDEFCQMVRIDLADLSEKEFGNKYKIRLSSARDLLLSRGF